MYIPDLIYIGNTSRCWEVISLVISGNYSGSQVFFHLSCITWLILVKMAMGLWRCDYNGDPWLLMEGPKNWIHNAHVDNNVKQLESLFGWGLFVLSLMNFTEMIKTGEQLQSPIRTANLMNRSPVTRGLWRYITIVAMVYTLWWTYKMLLKMAIEIVDFPMKNGGSFHFYVSSPEGINQLKTGEVRLLVKSRNNSSVGWLDPDSLWDASVTKKNTWMFCLGKHRLPSGELT